MRDWLFQHLVEAWWVLIAGLATYFAKRWVQANDAKHAKHEECFDAHDERIRQIEVAHVTRKDFDELRASMVGTFAEGIRQIREQVSDMRNETREERAQMHTENRELIIEMQRQQSRIHKRVDDLWERRSRSRAD